MGKRRTHDSDPIVGRFTSQDSYLGQLDDPPSLHRFVYAANNPTLYVDPSGHLYVTAEQARAMAERTHQTNAFLADVGTALKVEAQVLGEMAKDAFLGTAVLAAKTAIFFHPNPRISRQAGADLRKDAAAIRQEVVAHGEATGQVLAKPSVVLDSIEELGLEGSVRPYFKTAVTTALVVDAGAGVATRGARVIREGRAGRTEAVPAQGTVPPSKPTVGPTEGAGGEVVLRYKRNPRHSAEEFERQAAGQAEGLSGRTAAEIKETIEKVRAEGRLSEATEAVRAARRADPEAAAGKAATHRTDCCIGGDPKDISGFGDTGVNSSLGVQNRALQPKVYDAVKDLPTDVKPKVRLELEEPTDR